MAPHVTHVGTVAVERRQHSTAAKHRSMRGWFCKALPRAGSFIIVLVIVVKKNFCPFVRKRRYRVSGRLKCGRIVQMSPALALERHEMRARTFRQRIRNEVITTTSPKDDSAFIIEHDFHFFLLPNPSCKDPIAQVDLSVRKLRPPVPHALTSSGVRVTRVRPS